ncbi:hypothetical protein D3C73_1266470 [compost metagenome]
MGGVDGLAFPVTDGERAEQVRIGGSVPAFVDAVGNTTEQALLSLGGEETVQAAAERRGSDFLGVGGADRGDMA